MHFFMLHHRTFKVLAHLNPGINSSAIGVERKCEIAASQRGLPRVGSTGVPNRLALVSRSASPFDCHHPCRSSILPFFQGSPILPNSSESALVRYDARYKMGNAHDAGPSSSPQPRSLAWAPLCERVEWACVCVSGRFPSLSTRGGEREGSTRHCSRPLSSSWARERRMFTRFSNVLAVRGLDLRSGLSSLFGLHGQHSSSPSLPLTLRMGNCQIRTTTTTDS